MNKAVQVIFVTIFLLLVSGPMIVGIIEPDLKVSPAEKRQLTTLPDYQKTERIADYFNGLSAYVDDHFGFREFLIRNYNAGVLALGESPTDNVIAGKNGWHFYKAIDPLTIASLDPEEIKTNLVTRSRFIAQRSQIAEQNNVHYIFTVIPNKMSVYDEHLPPKYKLTKLVVSYDLFASELRKLNSKSLFDLFPVIRQLRDSESHSLYFKNDTHWNPIGAFHSAKNLLERSDSFFRSQDQIIQHTFKSRKKFGGDVANFMGLNRQLESDEPTTSHPNCVDLYKAENLKTEGLGVDFLKIVCGANDKVLLYMGDSFTYGISPFLAENVGTLYLASEGVAQAEFKDLLKQLKPDFVIEQMVQRNIAKTLLRKDR